MEPSSCSDVSLHLVLNFKLSDKIRLADLLFIIGRAATFMLCRGEKGTSLRRVVDGYNYFKIFHHAENKIEMILSRNAGHFHRGG